MLVRSTYILLLCCCARCLLSVAKKSGDGTSCHRLTDGNCPTIYAKLLPGTRYLERRTFSVDRPSPDIFGLSWCCCLSTEVTRFTFVLFFFLVLGDSRVSGVGRHIQEIRHARVEKSLYFVGVDRVYSNRLTQSTAVASPRELLERCLTSSCLLDRHVCVLRHPCSFPEGMHLEADHVCCFAAAQLCGGLPAHWAPHAPGQCVQG